VNSAEKVRLPQRDKLVGRWSSGINWFIQGLQECTNITEFATSDPRNFDKYYLVGNGK
jgi:hypothetical protein